MAQDLEQRILGRGSKVYKQPIFREVFESMRKFLSGVYASFENITDEQLYELLRHSAVDRNLLEYVRNVQRIYGSIDNTTVSGIRDFNRDHVFANNPLLEEYLKRLPQTLKWGTVSITSTLNLVPTYKSFVENFHQRPPPDSAPIQPGDLYHIGESSLASLMRGVAPPKH